MEILYIKAGAMLKENLIASPVRRRLCILRLCETHVGSADKTSRRLDFRSKECRWSS